MEDQYKKIKVGRTWGYPIVVTQGKTEHEAILLGCDDDNPQEYLNTTKNDNVDVKIKWKVAGYNDIVPASSIRLHALYTNININGSSSNRKSRIETDNTPSTVTSNHVDLAVKKEEIDTDEEDNNSMPLAVTSCGIAIKSEEVETDNEEEDDRNPEAVVSSSTAVIKSEEIETDNEEEDSKPSPVPSSDWAAVKKEEIETDNEEDDDRKTKAVVSSTDATMKSEEVVETDTTEEDVGLPPMLSPAPQLGPGWFTKYRVRDLSPYQYISPKGEKFRSMVEVERYLNNITNNQKVRPPTPPSSEKKLTSVQFAVGQRVLVWHNNDHQKATILGPNEKNGIPGYNILYTGEKRKKKGKQDWASSDNIIASDRRGCYPRQASAPALKSEEKTERDMEEDHHLKVKGERSKSKGRKRSEEKEQPKKKKKRRKQKKPDWHISFEKKEVKQMRKEREKMRGVIRAHPSIWHTLEYYND